MQEFDLKQWIVEGNDRINEAPDGTAKSHEALNTISDLMSQMETEIDVLEKNTRQYKSWQMMAKRLRRSIGEMEKSITKGVEGRP